MPSKWNLANLWPQLVIILTVVASFNYLKIAAITLGFALYILLALVYKPKEI
jgi:hypothetical protein